ncbi:uncharacterized protein LOC106514281 [Austrofundulus limnaeus]|uniref:Uncharacterized protein LOC106514281 n=1 Tax=Austrofundulus limnaeus TaxID=52670 RepID=A0A2I4ATV3_AUSLI|nr:PREDICTED: uncharacterized protein LOC106514281 [Austrofundulus limnaeus]
MSVPAGFTVLSLMVISHPASMHGLPCSSLGHCFGSLSDLSDVNADSAPSVQSNNSRSNKGLPEAAAGPVLSQPEIRPCSPHVGQHKPAEKTSSCISSGSTRSGDLNDTNSNCVMQDKHEGVRLGSPPSFGDFSENSEDELESEFGPEQKYPRIPRPSITIRQPKESKFQETESGRSDDRETEDGGLSGMKHNTGVFRFFIVFLFFPRSTPQIHLPAVLRWGCSVQI